MRLEGRQETGPAEWEAPKESRARSHTARMEPMGRQGGSEQPRRRNRKTAKKKPLAAARLSTEQTLCQEAEAGNRPPKNNIASSKGTSILPLMKIITLPFYIGFPFLNPTNGRR